MKMIFNALAKKLFGVHFERLTRTLLICPILYWGLYLADLRVRISTPVLYLMTGTFTAGVMWQALFSEDNAVNILNLLMLPFHNRKFVFSYVSAFGIYTFFTKTSVLLALLLAVSAPAPAQIFGSVLCAVNAVLMTAVIFSKRKKRYVCSLWAAATVIGILSLGNSPWFMALLSGNILLAAALLANTDGYAFYLTEKENRPVIKSGKHFSVWRYFFRYLQYHKNYLANTFIMWGVACLLPLFFIQTDSLSAAPVGFAVLTLNTPVCILLSADPALEQAVRFLPGQKKAFCIPYCLFLFSCNMAADIIFLCSLQILTDSVTMPMTAAAFFFALQSAVCSVLLEWFCPIRGWKIESDLWHHPRKYLVPALMLLLSAAVESLPALLPVLIVLLALETAVLSQIL